MFLLYTYSIYSISVIHAYGESLIHAACVCVCLHVPVVTAGSRLLERLAGRCWVLLTNTVKRTITRYSASLTQQQFTCCLVHLNIGKFVTDVAQGLLENAILTPVRTVCVWRSVTQ